MASKFYEHYVHNTVGLYDTTALTYLYHTHDASNCNTRHTKYHADCVSQLLHRLHISLPYGWYR